jgi:hypothetical protein
MFPSPAFSRLPRLFAGPRPNQASARSATSATVRGTRLIVSGKEA